VLAVLIIVSFGSDASSQQPPTAAELVLMGRLATVEPSARRISVIPDDSADRLELLVADDVAVVQEAEELTLADLVIQVGRRVTVRYRLDGDVPTARTITVDSPPAG
jgi:hypothetical protein